MTVPGVTVSDKYLVKCHSNLPKFGKTAEIDKFHLSDILFRIYLWPEIEQPDTSNKSCRDANEPSLWVAAAAPPALWSSVAVWRGERRLGVPAWRSWGARVVRPRALAVTSDKTSVRNIPRSIWVVPTLELMSMMTMNQCHT